MMNTILRVDLTPELKEYIDEKFNELHRRLQMIGDKTLAQTLADLDRDVSQVHSDAKSGIQSFRDRLAAARSQAQASGPSSVYIAQVDALEAKINQLDPANPATISNPTASTVTNPPPPGVVRDPSNPPGTVSSSSPQPQATNITTPGAGSDAPPAGTDSRQTTSETSGDASTNNDAATIEGSPSPAVPETEGSNSPNQEEPSPTPNELK